MYLRGLRVAAILGGFLFLLAVASAQPAVDDFSPVREPLPSAVLVLPKGGQGSGFVVSREDRLLVTCRHVADTDQEVDIVFPEYVGTQAYVTRDYYLKQAKRYKGKVLSADAGRDLAVIELRSMPHSARELQVSTASARVGDRTHLIGSPGGSPRVLEYVTGDVKSVQRREILSTSIIPKEGQPAPEPVHKVDASITEVATEQDVGPGFSGGPVVNDRNLLIGVISSRPLGVRDVISCIDSIEVPIVLSVAYCRLASRALGKREYSRAVLYCTKALKFNASNPLAYNERGAAYSYQDRYDDAIRDYTAAIRLNPGLARAHRNLASAYYYQEKYYLSLASCNDALRLDPNYAMAYLTRSKARAKLNQRVEADADYARAIQLDPALKPAGEK